MSYIIKGILSRELPWGLVLLGVFIAIVLELAGHTFARIRGGRLPACLRVGANIRRRHGPARSGQISATQVCQPKNDGGAIRR